MHPWGRGTRSTREDWLLGDRSLLKPSRNAWKRNLQKSKKSFGRRGGPGINLVPIGPVPTDLLSWLVVQVPESTGQPAGIGEALALPESAYDTHRRQYRGEALIELLGAIRDREARRVVGLTDADCYAPGLNFIFGQATFGGREALVALPRLRQSFYGLPEDLALFRQRALKEVIHELGHTWQLSHCPDPRCVMYFSNRLHDTDAKGVDFCRVCLERLRSREGEAPS